MTSAGQPVDVTALRAAVPDLSIQTNYPLAARTYFKLGGPAEVWVEPASISQVVAIVAWCAQQRTQLTVLGGASNVIVADEGIPGMVMYLGKLQTTQVIGQSEQLTTVQMEAGIATALAVKWSVDQGLSGLEYFLGVPGTLGGAILNNAHYLRYLIGERVTRVQTVTAQGELQWVSAAEADFGYDHSRFQTSREVIVTVEFALPAGDPETSRQLVAEATRYRAATQPLGEPSSGCVFQNAPTTPALAARFPQFADRSHIPAGFLIDQAGLKGEQRGQIMVSHKHAAFMINLGGGTAAQVRDLILFVKQRILDEFGVELHQEVFWLPKS